MIEMVFNSTPSGAAARYRRVPLYIAIGNGDPQIIGHVDSRHVNPNGRCVNYEDDKRLARELIAALRRAADNLEALPEE